MKKRIDLSGFDVSNATHLIQCKHCIGKNCKYYQMRGTWISKTNSGKIKMVVFGERNWKGKEHIKNIRYFSEERLSVIKT